MKKLFAIATLMALAMNGFAQILNYDFSAVCETGQTLYYRILSEENHEVAVTFPNSPQIGWGNYPQPEGDLIIPAFVEHENTTYTVVSIGQNAFDACQEIISVELPNSIRRIESDAFWYCSGLSSDLVIPDQCTFIGGYAFMGCSGLSSLTIGASVDTIQYSAFEDCIGLQSIHCNTPTPPFSEHLPSSPYYEDRSIFNNVPTDIPVYVNCLTFDQFLLNWDWSRFVNMEGGVFLGAPALTVGVNNPEYGTAEVVSIPEDCEHTTATVRATPNLGHVFGYWKRNGAVVSYSQEYTFTLDRDCVMTACFDCSITVYDSIAYPDHVITRTYDAAGQVTAEEHSDFNYDPNGVLTNFTSQSRTSYFTFFEFPSKPSRIHSYLGDHPAEFETLNFTYETDHQIKHSDHTRGNDYYYDINNHYDYYYTNHRLFRKDSSSTDESETVIWRRNNYAYENGNRTRIDSTYSGTTILSSVTTNHYNEQQQVLTSQTDNYDNTGAMTSRSLKTYTYTDSNKTDSIVTQVLNDGTWVNSGIAHYIYDFKNRVIEYQTGSWSAEASEWNITKKVLYEFNDETQIVTISFRKKNNNDWVWDVFSGQSLFNDSQLYEWQRQLESTYSGVNQFEISLHYNTLEQQFPILSEWYYELEWGNGNITYQHLEYAADTTIGNERPKIIVRTNTIYDRDEFTEITHEYILEEGNVVYWWNKDLEEFTTLYDYNAEAGDEWEIKVGTESIMVHVDSVGVFEYDGGTHKMLHISDAGDLFSGDIVVGYGHMTSFFPEKLMRRDANFTVNGLRCYWVEDNLVFKYGDTDCDAIYAELHNGINEDGPSTGSGTFAVYPNPTDGILFVQTLRATSLPEETYRITNLMGQTLLQGHISAETQQIDITILPAGMYFINVGETTLKFVIR